MISIIRWILATLLVTLYEPAFALVRGGRVAPMVVDLEYGRSTELSKAFESNDLGSSTRYSINAFAGKKGNLQFRLVNTTDTVSFSLNESSVTANWQDTVLQYSWGWLYLNAMFSRLEIKASKASSEILDAAASGFGYGLGFQYAFGNSSMIYLDVLQVTPSETKNTLDSDITIGARMEVDLATRIRLYKDWLDFTMGYRMRTTSYTGDLSGSDQAWVTHFGLRAAFGL